MACRTGKLTPSPVSLPIRPTIRKKNGALKIRALHGSRIATVGLSRIQLFRPVAHWCPWPNRKTFAPSSGSVQSRRRKTRMIAALFPRRFGDRYAMIHRPVANGKAGAHIWISFSPNLIHWGEHQLLLKARHGAWWDASKIGLGPPPLETAEGWLIMYHGVRLTASGSLYRVGLALLDLDDPRRVLRRSNEWVFAPETPYECLGDVPTVVFPCGWIHDKPKGTIRLYYGGADTCLAMATASLSDILDYLRDCPAP